MKSANARMSGRSWLLSLSRSCSVQCAQAARILRYPQLVPPTRGSYAPARARPTAARRGKGREERERRGEGRRGRGTPREVGVEALRQAAVRQAPVSLQHMQHPIYF
jgi:hypothetical protein